MENAYYSFNLIKVLEGKIRFLYVLKINLNEMKPFWFQYTKLKKYQKIVKLIDQKITECESLLLEEYLKLELSKK